MTLKERAEVVAELAADGFCTHYPGYLCDRDWSKDPTVCPKCITSWIIRNGITERDDTRINRNGGNAHGEADRTPFQR